MSGTLRAPRCARLLALAALAATPARARVFSGSLSGGGGEWPFLARFSFGADASGAPVGTASMSFTYPGAAGAPGPGVPPVSVFMFDDVVWAGVYPSQPCAAATAMDPSAVGFAVLPLVPPPGGGSPATETFVETARPHIWFFTAAAPGGCAAAPLLASYSLELRQADGGQLGYDELGMPSIYGAFLALNALVLLAHALAHYFPAALAAALAACCGARFAAASDGARGAAAAARGAAAAGGGGGSGGAPRVFAPAIVRCFTASLALFCAASLLHACDWATAAATGVGAPAAGAAGDFLRIGSLMALCEFRDPSSR